MVNTMRNMKKRTFTLWHSIVGLFGLVFVEAALLSQFPQVDTLLIVGSAGVGALATLYIATEVIEEVRNARHMLVLLSVVLAEFVLFFACEYWFLLMLDPLSFPTLLMDPVSLILHSVMIFVFNPLAMPGTFTARALLLVNTLGALGLAMFILQNVWQFRRVASKD